MFDHDLRYLSARGLGLSDVGLSRELLEACTISQVFPSSRSRGHRAALRAALRGDPSETDVAYEGRIYLQRLGPLHDENGTIVAAMGFTQDVTTERMMARELARENERLNEAQRLSRDQIRELSRTYRVRRSSPAASSCTAPWDQDEIDNEAAGHVRMPTLLMAAEGGLAARRATTKPLLTNVVSSVEEPRSGHWLPEENPRFVITRLLRFFSAS